MTESSDRLCDDHVVVHTSDELVEALQHLGYEVWMAATAAERLAQLVDASDVSEDGVAANAFLESMLLHARSLTDFFVRTSRYASDIRRTDFAPEWKPAQLKLPNGLKPAMKYSTNICPT